MGALLAADAAWEQRRPKISAQFDRKKVGAVDSFIVNWNGPQTDFPTVEAELFAAIKGVLRVIKRALQ
jgi:hypothetical protein